MAENYNGKSYREAFWEGVAIPPGAPREQCWEWKRYKTKRGYGAFRGEQSHRIAYLLEHGPIPQGGVIRHGCDNPSCCNPHHLSVGTQQDNMNDAIKRVRGLGRKPSLTADQVRELRYLRKQGVPYDDLEIKFNLNRASLCEIAKGKSYRWVV